MGGVPIYLMNGNFGLSISVSFTLSFDLGKKSTRFSFFVIPFASIIDIQLQISCLFIIRVQPIYLRMVNPNTFLLMIFLDKSITLYYKSI